MHLLYFHAVLKAAMSYLFLQFQEIQFLLGLHHELELADEKRIEV